MLIRFLYTVCLDRLAFEPPVVGSWPCDSNVPQSSHPDGLWVVVHHARSVTQLYPQWQLSIPAFLSSPSSLTSPGR